MESEDSKKPLAVKIISPAGVFYDSQKSISFVKSIIAKGVISSQRTFYNIGGEVAFDFKGEAEFDFEILPGHSPFVAKVSPNSEIRVRGNNDNKNDNIDKYSTINGGIVRVSYNDTYTLAVFTLEDVKDPIEKK
jgi:F0F1-type ATP synthase epsilon subunit